MSPVVRFGFLPFRSVGETLDKSASISASIPAMFGLEIIIKPRGQEKSLLLPLGRSVEQLPFLFSNLLTFVF